MVKINDVHFSSRKILFLLRRDEALRQEKGTFTDEQLFVDALERELGTLTPAQENQARIDFLRFKNGCAPPAYIKDAIVGIMAAYR